MTILFAFAVVAFLFLRLLMLSARKLTLAEMKDVHDRLQAVLESGE